VTLSQPLVTVSELSKPKLMARSTPPPKSHRAGEARGTVEQAGRRERLPSNGGARLVDNGSGYIVGLERGSTSTSLPGFKAAIAGAARPNECPAFCSAMAQIAVKMGLARLVPPHPASTLHSVAVTRWARQYRDRLSARHREPAGQSQEDPFARRVWGRKCSLLLRSHRRRAEATADPEHRYC
jgi:hypothetical protein